VRLHPGVLLRLAAAGWLLTPRNAAGWHCLPVCCQIPASQASDCTHTRKERCREGVSAAEHLARCVSWGLLEGKEKTLLWGRDRQQPEAPLAQPQQRDTRVFRRLKHLQSPNKQRRVVQAPACRLQDRDRGEIRWPHPEGMAEGAGCTELSCLPEEEVGMVLLGEHV